jgi:hypothetical protein
MAEIKGAMKYTLNLAFEEIKLPPFEDILVVGRNSQHGKLGLTKALELMLPNRFQTFEVEDERVQAIFVNKRILEKMDIEKILEILRDKVFKSISEEEMIKVDFLVKIQIENIEGEL